MGLGCVRGRAPLSAASSAVSETMQYTGDLGSPGPFLAGRYLLIPHCPREYTSISRASGDPAGSRWPQECHLWPAGPLLQVLPSLPTLAGPDPAGGLWSRGDHPYQCCWFPHPVSGPITAAVGAGAVTGRSLRLSQEEPAQPRLGYRDEEKEAGLQVSAWNSRGYAHH